MEDKLGRNERMEMKGCSFVATLSALLNAGGSDGGGGGGCHQSVERDNVFRFSGGIYRTEDR